jgi:hypothetical protein
VRHKITRLIDERKLMNATDYQTLEPVSLPISHAGNMVPEHMEPEHMEPESSEDEVKITGHDSLAGVVPDV